jgi:biotin carboxyl carrier protein
LQNKLPQAICGDNIQSCSRASARQGDPGDKMADVKIVTDVAGRVCALPVTAGTDISEGDEVAFVEAMKMEIPVTSTAVGKLKTLLVHLDDVVAEGQAIAIVET